MKNIKVFTIIISLLVLLAACDEKNYSIVGRWEAVDAEKQGFSTEAPWSEIEFFNDGTFTSNLFYDYDDYDLYEEAPASGEYIINDSRIELSGVYSRFFASFDITEDTLTIYDDEGGTYEYIKED